MKKKSLHFKHSLALLPLATLLWLSTPAISQTLPAQGSGQAGPQDAVPQNDDTSRREVATFDQFMDGHPEIAEQLRKDPSLVKNEEFVEKHPALREYLQQHPGVREEITENPNAFMRQERRFDQRENNRDEDTTHGELESFGRFLGSHSEISEQLSKDPSLVKNEEYVENHPTLRQFLKDHPGVREELRENPQAFMKSAQQFSNSRPAPDGNPKPKH